MNPFIQVYNSLWQLVESHPRMRGPDPLVRVANRVKFDTRSLPKDNPLTADLPELVLTGDGGMVSLHQTSSSTRAIKRYSWLVSTGDMRVQAVLHDVEWVVLEAMADWRAVLSVLTWQGKQFVTRLDVTDVTEGLSNPEANRGIHGWSAVWSCEVEMHFKTADLIDATGR